MTNKQKVLKVYPTAYCERAHDNPRAWWVMAPITDKPGRMRGTGCGVSPGEAWADAWSNVRPVYRAEVVG